MGADRIWADRKPGGLELAPCYDVIDTQMVYYSPLISG